jgi:ATP-dependent Lon protease
LVPKQIREHGIKPEQIEIMDEAVLDIIASYTREAGVRSLERRIADVCRSVAVKVASGDVTVKHVISRDRVEELLGPQRVESEIAERTAQTGVAAGLAWTPYGGDLLFIESTRMVGKGGLTLTGKLGDVMKESAQAAMSYLRTNSDRLGVNPSFLDKTDIHIHVPDGAMPKDGPSAGVTMLTALTSLMTGIKVRNDTAMTGEATLRGLVLPVGGIKEKVLAAHRAGIKRIIMPAKNKKDMIDVPEQVQKDIEFFHVSRMDEVLNLALERSPFVTPPPADDKGTGEIRA